MRNLGMESNHDAEGLSNHVAQEDGHLKSGKENKLQLTRSDKPGSGSVRQVCKHADRKDGRLDQSRLPYGTLQCFQDNPRNDLRDLCFSFTGIVAFSC